MTENTSNKGNSQDNVNGVTEEKTIDSKNYVIVLHVTQTHYTLDITEHIKDSMNTVDIPMPITKEFYDSVNVGDIINDDFRVGSFVVKGSFGKWKISSCKS